MNKLFANVTNALSGRTTFWLVAFFITGNTFHALGKLDATYISFMLSFMGIALGHSIKEDYFSSKTTVSGDNGGQ